MESKTTKNVASPTICAGKAMIAMRFKCLYKNPYPSNSSFQYSIHPFYVVKGSLVIKLEDEDVVLNNERTIENP